MLLWSLERGILTGISLNVLWLSCLKYCTWAYELFMDCPSELWTHKPPGGAY